MRRTAFFPPGLDPVLDRGAGNENAMIPPEVPARSSERYTVLDDQADGQVDDALGVVASRRRQIGGVRVEVLATLGAVVLGVGQDDVVWSSGTEIAEVVQDPLELAIAVSAVSTPRTRPSFLNRS